MSSKLAKSDKKLPTPEKSGKKLAKSEKSDKKLPTTELSESPRKKLKTENEETDGLSQDVKNEPVKEETIEQEELIIKDEIKEEMKPTTDDEMLPTSQMAQSPGKKRKIGDEESEVKEETIEQEEAKKEDIQEKEATSEPAPSKQTIFEFTITLLRGRGAPKIWRRFQVPETYTFRQFHIAIQKAMGWKSDLYDYHLHAFTVLNPSTGEEDSIRTREDLSFYEDPKDENLTKIKDYFSKRGQKGNYEYDFGCGWEHEFVFEKSFVGEAGGKYPKCVAGAKACPPEDGVVHSDEEYDSDAFDADACF